eukprot:188508-Prymnesium_polylepis.1
MLVRRATSVFSLSRRRGYSTAISFADYVRPELVETLRTMGCVAPNEMQARALERAVAGKDVIISAQTGAGKTLAFLLPLVHRLSLERPPRAAGPNIAQPDGLVIVPTPELVAQVAAVAADLTAALPEPIVIGRVTGPSSSAASIASARLVVTTPEEMLRRKREGTLSLAALQAIAVDEADSILCGELHSTHELPPLEHELCAPGCGPADDRGDAVASGDGGGGGGAGGGGGGGAGGGGGGMAP